MAQAPCRNEAEAIIRTQESHADRRILTELYAATRRTVSLRGRTPGVRANMRGASGENELPVGAEGLPAATFLLRNEQLQPLAPEVSD